MRVARCFGLFFALVLTSGSAFAASSGWTRYTFPAAPPSKVASPGTLTVRLPADWIVRTTWPTPMAESGAGRDAILWWPGASLEAKGTTLADVRTRMLGWAGTVWGEGTPTRVYVGDSYLTLPMGKVWRLTMALVPPKGDTRVGLWYERDYVLDRGVVWGLGAAAKFGGYEYRQLFTTLTVICPAKDCKTHNGQLAAIMRSIRITS